MECGHGGICYDCGKHLLGTYPNVCHLCREEISYVLKMDLTTVYSNFIKVISATFIDDESDDSEGGGSARDINNNRPPDEEPTASQVSQETTTTQAS